MLTSANEEPFVVRVLVLGPPGAGKTVFLSSLFRRLSVQHADTGFHLDCNQDQRTKLNDIYARVADTEGLWPPHTRAAESTEYKFDCKLRYHGLNHSILQINYIDYAGDLLTGSREEGASAASAALQSQVQLANVVLCLIDGAQMLDFLHHTTRGQRHFDVTMQPIFSILQEVEKPIHFVLTKWDLLHNIAGDEAESLRLVKETLLGIEEILTSPLPQLATSSTPGRGQSMVRLIPVSSVGFDFAVLEAGDDRRKEIKCSP